MQRPDVDRIFAAVRPRRLLFLAIDGIAPRAKMNQQRVRRFRSAQEARERREAKDETRKELVGEGYDIDDDEEDPKSEWDSNVITPGTTFMYKLGEYIRFYIADRMNSDPAWRNIKVQALLIT